MRDYSVDSDLRRILVIRLRQLGDTLLVTPLVRQLKRVYPDAEVDVLCQPQNSVIFQHSPHVATRHMLPRKCPTSQLLGVVHAVRRRRYDLVIDCHGLPKTAALARASGGKQRVGYEGGFLRGPACYTCAVAPEALPDEYFGRRNLRLWGDHRADFDDLDLDFPIGEADQEAAEAFAHEFFRGPAVAMHVVAQEDAKRWPPEKFAEVADRLALEGFTPWLVYGPGQERLAQEVVDRMASPAVAGYPMLSFAELMGVMRRCALFVGNDGGPHHVAAAAGLPMVSLFRISPVPWTRPARPHQRFLAPEEVRTPCDACGRFLPHAFKEIPVESVWEEIQHVLRAAPAISEADDSRTPGAAEE